MDVDSYNDVVNGGVATEKFALRPSTATDDEDILKSTYTVVGRTVDTTTFYISVPRQYQEFDSPSVTAMKGPQGAKIAAPTVGGDAVMGGNITGDTFVRMELEYNCIRSGVTRILVNIPLLPVHYGYVSFRVMKVCGDFKTRVEWYWTAPRIMTLGVSILIVAGAVYLYFKSSLFSGKEGYTALANQEANATNHSTSVPIDNFEDDLDIDSESD
jgi:hypothetical protein